MPIVVACPSCQTRLKVPDQSAGKMVKCPKCSAAISVPLTGNEPLPTTPPVAPPPPAAPSAPTTAPAADAGEAAAPKKSKKGLYIGLGAGAVLLMSCCCLGVVTSIVSYIYLSGEKNENVTKANFEKLHKNDKLSQVETVLGPDKGKEAKADDIRAAFKGASQSKIDDLIGRYGTKLSDGSIYRWRNSDDWIFVIFDKAPKGKDGKEVADAHATHAIWVSNSGGVVSSEEKTLP